MAVIDNVFITKDSYNKGEGLLSFQHWKGSNQSAKA